MKPSTLLKYLALLFILITFSLYHSCQKDDTIAIEYETKQQEFTVTLIHKSELSENQSVRAIVETLPNQRDLTLNSNFNLQGRLVYTEEHNFYVDDKQAYHITYGDYESYTFAIVRPEDNGLTENLVVSKQTDGTYKTSIMSYDLTEDERQLVIDGVIPTDIKSKTSVQPLSQVSSSNDPGIVPIGNTGIYYDTATGGCVKPVIDLSGETISYTWTSVNCPESITDNGVDGGGNTSSGSEDSGSDSDSDTNSDSGYDSTNGNTTGGDDGGNTNGTNSSTNSGNTNNNNTTQNPEGIGTVTKPLEVMDADGILEDCLGWSNPTFLATQSLSIAVRHDLANFINTNGCSHETIGTLDRLTDYLLDGEITSVEAQLLIDFHMEADWKQLLRNAIADGITETAELMHLAYKKLSEIANEYPSSIDYINIVVDELREIADEEFNTNSQTLDWEDLFGIWLFELGNYPNNSGVDTDIQTIYFYGDDTTTQLLKQQEGVSQARQMALDRIANNNIATPVVNPWSYGQNEFYDTLVDSNLVTAFLGSYTTRVNITLNTDGTHTLTFSVDNPSTWDSATRFRIDNDGDNHHDGIFENTYRENQHEANNITHEINLGGNINQNWTWTEIIN